MITYPLSLGLHSTTDIVQAVNDLNARLLALEIWSQAPLLRDQVDKLTSELAEAKALLRENKQVAETRLEIAEVKGLGAKSLIIMRARRPLGLHRLISCLRNTHQRNRMKLIPVVTPHGTAVKIELSGNDVAVAIDAWLVARRVIVVGPRTIRVNGELCSHGEVYVDPSGYVLRKGAMIAASSAKADPAAVVGGSASSALLGADHQPERNP